MDYVTKIVYYVFKVCKWTSDPYVVEIMNLQEYFINGISVQW